MYRGLELSKNIEACERPANIQEVEMPYVQVGGNLEGVVVRLALHTDALANFVKIFDSGEVSLPSQEVPSYLDYIAFDRKPVDTSKLFIEVRLPTNDEWAAIQASPRYRYHLEGRYLRFINTPDGDASTKISLQYIYPKDINIKDTTKFRSVHKPVTIAQLDGISYRSGFVPVNQLVEVGKRGDILYNELLRYLGGCTGFDIGSDFYSPEELKEIRDMIVTCMYLRDGSFGSAVQFAMLKAALMPGSQPQIPYASNVVDFQTPPTPKRLLSSFILNPEDESNDQKYVGYEKEEISKFNFYYKNNKNNY